MAGKGGVARLLAKHRTLIVRDLDVLQVLPHLVSSGVFTHLEERHILTPVSRLQRADEFLKLLSRKDHDAFHEFCYALEQTYPHLLTRFILDNKDAIPNDTGSPKSMQLDYELALRERNSALRENARASEERNLALQQYRDMKRERDYALASLDSMVTQSPKISTRDYEVNQKPVSPPTSPSSKRSFSPTKFFREKLRSLTNINELETEEGGERTAWETHHVTLTKVPGYGFGIAVSGGRDNPHFSNGDPAIAISDVLKAGPAEGKLQINDRVMSVNGITLENVEHDMAIALLKDSGNSVSLVIRRKGVAHSHEGDTYQHKVTLTKKGRRDEFGVVLGCRFYVKEITGNSLAAQDGGIKEGDYVLKVNGTPLEMMTLQDARKLVEKAKDRLQLLLMKPRQTSPKKPNTGWRDDVDYIPSRGPRADLPQKKDNLDRMYGSLPHNLSRDQIYDRPPLKPISFEQLDRPTGPRDHRAQSPYERARSPYKDPHRPTYEERSRSPYQPERGRSPYMNGPRSPYEEYPRPAYEEQPRPSAYADIPRRPVPREEQEPQYREISRYRDQREPPREPAPPRPPLPDMIEGAPPRPPSPQSNQPPPQEDTYGKVRKDDAREDRNKYEGMEPRAISFRKENGVGIRIAGGNATGIFVATVAEGTPAEQQGIRPGDQILQVNDIDMKGKTREEAVLFLLSLHDQVNLLVQFNKTDFDKVMAAGGTGDSFYVKTHFSYEVPENNEMSFRSGDTFHITDTLCGGVVGAWEATKVGKNKHGYERGIIPNKSRAEHLAGQVQSATDKNNSSKQKGGSFFKKKTARRSKSLGKDHWDEVIFGFDAAPSSKYPVYERVTLRDAGFIRPVVIFGHLSDFARDKLVKDYPERYECPQTNNRKDEDGKNRSGIIKLDSIRKIIDKGKHCVLDVTPNAVDRLNYRQLCPIVLFLQVKDKQECQDLRAKWTKSSKNAKKLYEQATKLEKMYSHLFTATINVTSTDAWLKQLKETIEKTQLQQVWMAEKKPEEAPKEEFLFPMANRLSYVSYPESDGEYVRTDTEEPPRRNKLVRSSSDPSLATQENIPGIPPYPNPPGYQRDFRQDMGMRRDQRDRRRDDRPPPRHSDYRERYMRPDDRYYPGYHSDTLSGGYSQRDRGNIDYYATLTPSERLRAKQESADRYRDGPYNPDRNWHWSTDRLPSDYERDPDYQYRRPDYGRRPYDSRDDHSSSSDSYTKYTSNPANKHDDSKLREKFGTTNPMLVNKPSKIDPYQFTRSTNQPYSSSTVDRTKLSDLKSKYRAEETLNKPRMNGRGPIHGPEAGRPHPDQLRAKSESSVYPEDAHWEGHPSQQPYDTRRSHPALHNGPVHSDDPRLRDYDHLPRSRGPDYNNYSDPYGPPRRDPYIREPDSGFNTYERDSYDRQQPRSGYHQQTHREGDYSRVWHQGPPPPTRSYSNQTYMDSSDIARSTIKEEQTAPPQPPPPPPPQEEEKPQEEPRTSPKRKFMYSFDSYKRLVTPGFYGSRKDTDYHSDRETSASETQPSEEPVTTSSQDEKRNSAFEMYKKPPTTAGANTFTTDSTQTPVPSVGELSTTSKTDDVKADEDRNLKPGEKTEEGHTVVATARGVFDSNGGVLESKETGVSIIIPKGAIQEGIKQEIYFKVCQDNSILPPLDRDKGETLLSPLVMCGPHGLKFLQPVELRLPHCASVNPESWSFSLKSSDSPSGQPTQWQNMTLAGVDGVSQGRVGKSSVSVLVDHF